MNWNAASDSDNEMFQMTSQMREDNSSRVRLLSVSDEDDDSQGEMLPANSNLPQLHFRQNAGGLTRAQEEKKYKLAIISIVAVGVAITVILNIGLGIKLRGMDNQTDKSKPELECPKEKPTVDKKCNETFPWQEFRLPTYVHPESYSIFLHPNLTEGTFSGVVDIVIGVTKATSQIVLHSRALHLNAIHVYEADKEIDQQEPSRFCEELDFVAILLSKPLSTGKNYTVHIEFNANLTKALDGFYLSHYKTKEGINKTLATTQFEAISARAAFPCFDEPSLKATFSLRIVRDPNYHTLSNMPVQSTSNYDNNLKLDKFQTSVPMSTYLVAFVISEFSNVTETIPLKKGSIPVSVYAPSDKIKTATFALEVACKVLAFYEKVFKVPYPLPKLDLVAIPDFQAGAMENWGLVTYRETAILWDEQTASVIDKEWVAIVIAHELAHQWFGNLVTMKWWNDLWLNEGFASYVEFLGVNKIYPSWNIMYDFNDDDTTEAMKTDESEYTHPISVTVENAGQIEEMFDSISYSKGACIISMVIGYLGEDAFFSGVADYLNKFSFNNTINKDLVNAVSLRASSNQQQSNIVQMLDSWTTEPGFPILNVSLVGNQVTVSQKRYLLSAPKESDSRCKNQTKSPIWQVPLSYKTDLSKKVLWNFMETKETQFSVEGHPNWVIFNVDRQGYYLINYETKLLSSLSSLLKKDHTAISEIDRSGILFNVAKSAKAGLIGYDTLLDVMTYIKKEDGYGPINTALLMVISMENRLKMQFYTEVNENFKKFSKKLFVRLYDKYGWPSSVEMKKNKTLLHPEIKMRKRIASLMCLFDHKNCTKQALEHFRQWRNNSHHWLPPDYKTVIYYTGIRLGNEDDWNYMWEKYKTDLKIDALEKRKMLSALSQVKDEKRIAFLLDESLTGVNIRHQDTGILLTKLARSRAGCALVWKFVRTRWETLIKIMPINLFGMQRLIGGIFDAFTDRSEIAGAKQFLTMKNISHIRYMKRALDQAEFNVHLIEANQPKIAAWLSENIDTF